jgi:phosphoglycolate phosphatase
MASVPGIRKEEVVYIGDSDVDMQTGANAGVRAIGVLWGFRPRKELEAHRPWRLVESAEKLEQAILEEQ